MPTWSSNLKIELLDTGAANWGNLTNNNFKWALEESITGYVTATFPSDANYNWGALYTNSNSSQEQRNLVIRVAGTLSATREFIVPTIEKQYIIYNNTTGSQSITVKTSAGTGVTVPNGFRMHVYVDGTNVVQMSDYGLQVRLDSPTLQNVTVTGSFSAGNATFSGTINGFLFDNGGGALSSNMAIGTNALNTNTSGSRNLAIGYDALTDNTTGARNLAIGYLALENNTTGTDNVAIGSSVLRLVTTTIGNVGVGAEVLAKATSGVSTAVGYLALAENLSGSCTAIGSRALQNNTTGGVSTAIGASALIEQTTGSWNTAVGADSSASITTGNYNVSVGYNSLKLNTTGTTNVAVGAEALYTTTDASDLVAVGYKSLYSQTSGIGQNNAVGAYALYSNTTGNRNNAIGTEALYTNQTGNANVAIGSDALYSNTSGSDNTALGREALDLCSTGFRNIGIGTDAGDVIETGYANIILGCFADPSSSSGNDQIVIGVSLVGKGNDTAFIGGTNGAYNEKNVTTWETTSDQRIKKNIVDNNEGLEKVLAVRVRNFEYRSLDEITEVPRSAAVAKVGTQLGVIAQEMLPECVSQTSDGVLSVNTDALIWYLVNAVKQLNAKVEQLQGASRDL